MRIVIALLLFGAAAAPAVSEPVTGPVIAGYGPVYYVPEEPLELPPDVRLKALFDVAAAPEEAGERNYRIETVARYLNMHARAGVEPRRLSTAVVLHGSAARSALSEEAFEARHGEPHPDAELIRRLTAAGVQFVICGQSAAAAGFRPDELAPDVKMSLSAMTALVRYQSDGFALIPWGTD